MTYKLLDMINRIKLLSYQKSYPEDCSTATTQAMTVPQRQKGK